MPAKTAPSLAATIFSNDEPLLSIKNPSDPSLLIDLFIHPWACFPPIQGATQTYTIDDPTKQRIVESVILPFHRRRQPRNARSINDSVVNPLQLPPCTSLSLIISLSLPPTISLIIVAASLISAIVSLTVVVASLVSTTVSAASLISTSISLTIVDVSLISPSLSPLHTFSPSLCCCI
ncbi:hypothetical protein ACLOJK_040855 [Asimina triloba]